MLASISSRSWIQNPKVSRVALNRFLVQNSCRYSPPTLFFSRGSGKAYFSSSIKQQHQQPIRILYASQTGTAQLFAHQLEEELSDEFPDLKVSVQAWQDQPATKLLELKNADNDDDTPPPLHVFLCSVTGVGEPPDNGKEFYNYIMDTATQTTASKDDLEYTVFGLGNQKAHPNYFNVIAKGLDKRLEELGAKRVHPLGLGDDGDCIEDDFDQWMDNFLELVKKKRTNNIGGGSTGTEVAAAAATADGFESDSPAEAVLDDKDILADDDGGGSADKDIAPRMACPGATKPDGTRRISKKYPALSLAAPQSDIVREDLFHLQGTASAFYKDGTAKVHVLSNRILSPNAGDQALNEMRVGLKDYYLDDGTDDSLEYKTGDHFAVYPRNSQCIVEAYLQILDDVHPHAIIQGKRDETTDSTRDHMTSSSSSSYPFPPGLTVYETLSHCVDLGALPSPALSRQILGRKQLDYKNEIANPRRTVIDLILESSSPRNRLCLEDLLYQMVPMKPRYYSIASSNLATPDEIRLTFRPVKYMTSRGLLREGIATSYLLRKGVVGGSPSAITAAVADDAVSDDNDDDDFHGHVAAFVNPNPSFRLPEDPTIPIMLIAGGCGVAPIRAFIAERIALGTPAYGPGTLYLGFRNPKDAVYQSLIDNAIACGALTEAKICFDHGCSDKQHCMRVSELLRSEGQRVWDHLETGGYAYLCGGARTFGTAIEGELLEIFQEYGNMTFGEATGHLRCLVESGRLMEDLAD